MAAKRLRVRQIRTVLKLRYENQLPQREIARVCGIGNGTVSECLRRAREAGVEWPLADDLTDEALEQRLYPSGSSGSDLEKPDFASIHRELSRPGVTLQLLWIEYREVHPEGYSYSRFCELYQRFRGKAPRHDAPGARGWEADLRRLLGEEAADRRPEDRRG